ncbi:arylesterase [Spiribacter insolitus]|uniref:Arylesterase n=1 Tax=Spiribacter insolitus TaxID=3122417 RepID=A0ABV3T9R9_9GAMM
MRTRLLTVLLVFGLALPGLISAQTAGPRILVLGDSLSAAYNMPAEAGWVALLADRLGAGAEVVNAAISGETTAGARARLPQALENHAPDIVVIALGGNDGLRGVSLSEVRDNLDAMITMARDAGARVVLAGVRLPSNYGSAFIERFRNVYAEVARDTDVAYVPKILAGVAEQPSLMQDDGIHPNTRAQPRILDNIWQALGPMVSGSTTG